MAIITPALSPTLTVRVTGETVPQNDSPFTVTIDLEANHLDPSDARYLADLLLIAAEQADRLSRAECHKEVSAWGAAEAAQAARTRGVEA